jgi:hypothetical protein
MQLSVVMPSNRTGLSAYARILDACACADENIEVVIRDNSGCQEKRDFLSGIVQKNCQVVIADPCNAIDNSQAALSLTQGDFVIFVGDDDLVARIALTAVADLAAKIRTDSSVVGITGEYIIESSAKTALFRYPPLDSASASQRVADYVGALGPNLIFYSAIRNQLVTRITSFYRTLPFCFSFLDQMGAMMYLVSGKFVSIDRVLYQYDSSNWDTCERANQSDLHYYYDCGLDGSVLRLHWLICGLEGAKTVLGKYPGINLSPDERQAVATRWFSANYQRFRLGGMYRTDPSSRFDRHAIALCQKWKQITGISLDQLLTDLTGLFALSNLEGACKYFDFWKG